MLITIARRLAIIALALPLAGGAFATEEKRTDSPEQIHRAVFADGRLWLLAGGGRLSHIAEGGERTHVTTPDPVMGLFVQDGRVAIVTCQPECVSYRSPGERWTVRRRVGDAWETVAEVATKGERFVAATASMLLTDSRVIDLSHGGASEMALTVSATAKPAAPKPFEEGPDFRYGGSTTFGDDDGANDLDAGKPSDTAPTSPSPEPAPGPPAPLGRPVAVLFPARVSAVLVTPKHVFVGYDAGEFGGGLQQIDRATGEVSDLEVDRGSVKGIATIPWKPDCIAVAIGLIHFVASGRIVEVCDTTVRELYTHAIPASTYQSLYGRKDSLWSAQTTAFFGLQRRGGDLLAVGNDGLYQIGDGGAQQLPFPSLQPIGALAVSFDLPDVVLLLITGTQGLSQNNGALMLVPR